MPYVDRYGFQHPDAEGMTAPYVCGICNSLHDAGKAKVVARYADCSVWLCPHCGGQQDDRESWGFHGPQQARKVERRGR
jgi:hypothetical protein